MRYNYEISDDTYIFGFGGFDIGFALSAASSSGSHIDELKIGSSESDDLKSSDLGISLGAGILFNSLELRLGFSNGISDISPSKYGQVYNRVFFAGIGYRFGK